MSHKQVLQLIITVILVISFLVGCGSSTPTTVSEAPVATSVPEQAVATSTPEPPTSTPEPPPATPTPEPPTETPTPEPPTATPTPEPPTETPTPATIDPQPGATFTGELKGDEGAGSGTITFTTSKDGSSLADIKFAVTGGQFQSLKCSDGSSSSMGEISFVGPFPLTGGKIDASLSEGGKLTGEFISPTEANGKAEIVVKIPAILGNPAYTCDFGTWEWSAKSGASASESASPVQETESSAVGNLAEGTALVLGSLEAEVSSVEEATTMPNFGYEAQPNMKFVVIKLKVTKPAQEVNAENFILENASGKQYSPTGGFALLGTDILMGFEVPKDENLEALTLSYK